MKERIAVIGAGVIGLNTALRAQAQGHDVRVYYDKPPLETTSAKTGASFMPYCVVETPATSRMLEHGWGAYSDMNQNPEAGVWWSTRWQATSLDSPPHVTKASSDQNFEVVWGRDNIPGGYPQALRFNTYIIDSPQHLRWLQGQFTEDGGTMVQRRFDDPEQLTELPEKVVTYEGVEASLANSRNQEPKLKNQKYFLYVGNAYPHKNLERLLLAFKEATAKRKDIKLVLVGKKDFFYERLQKRIEELGIAENVLVFHEINDSELQSLYQNSLAVVLPSLMEGFGLPAIEAMANLQTLIVSDIPAFREICEGAGIYFDPSSTEDLADKLVEVIDSPDDQKYLAKIKAGQARLEVYSWKTMAEQTLAIYESTFPR